MSVQEPKVTVVVPVYNVEQYINQCLDSLIKQTLREIEIIVVDDGSPDNCPQIIDEYASKDERITPVHKQNEGVSVARNVGIEKARGEYLYFVDSDDWLEEDALKTLYEVAQRDHADVVIGDYKRIYYDGKSIAVTTFPHDFTTRSKETIQTIQKAVFCNGYSNFHAPEFSSCRGLAAPWHQMVRKSLILDNNIRFNPRVKGMFDDGLFTLEVYEYAQVVSYVNKICYNYRIATASLTKGYNPALLDKYVLALQEIDKTIARLNKTDDLMQYSMIRRFVYLNLAVENCFLNPQNHKKESERYSEFLDYANKPEFSCMYGELVPSMVGLRRNAFLASLVNRKHFRVYWIIKKNSR